MLNTLRYLEKVRVGDILVHKGFITSDKLNQVLIEQRHTSLKLGEMLIGQGLLTPKQLRDALAEQEWRNWIAIVLFAVGFLGGMSAKLAIARPSNLTNTPALTAQNTVAPVNVPNIALNPQTYSSLVANPNPTVALPLIGFCNPLNGLGYLSQGIRGSTHRGRMEYAYDLGSNIGTPVYAMRAGRVLGVQDRYPDSGGGSEKISKFNYVLMEHDGGYRSAYLHLQQGFRSLVQIKAGDLVEKGQLIGYSGNSGWSSEPHLHIEIQKPGDAFSFGQTVPFAIDGGCGVQDGTTARH